MYIVLLFDLRKETIKAAQFDHKEAAFLCYTIAESHRIDLALVVEVLKLNPETDIYEEYDFGGDNEP